MPRNPELPIGGDIRLDTLIPDGGRRAEEIPDGGRIAADILNVLDQLDQ